ncbi:hypothetical protein IVA98_32900 [Bradyrhizobium sp. 160]|uniref:hypothetical protein n=1 Tax=unclassified Bradyrhizobium TaxID=2631580 RepID=UPI001FF7C0F2|nr:MULTISPECIES: hypothetical protein [unclassified Bradyrhizobium]MCK1542200.1 hypothetical protein [Bradyrhizobium sp. 179]MCK1627828.1 hypothetical protein [Bradyrhizobium sp. 160]
MKQKQFKISLDDALRGTIDAAAHESGRSAAEEIRVRLDRSFREDGSNRDPGITALARDISEIVEQLLDLCWWKPKERGAWKDDRHVHDALRVAINEWLEATRPADHHPSAAADDLFDPRTLGMAAVTAFKQKKKQRADQHAAMQEAHAAALKDVETSQRKLTRMMNKARKDIDKEGGKK